jgi:DMSO/TMAO reductase YedYZ heme-binding membrane subunit
MMQIRDKMQNLNTWMRKLPYERKNLGYLCDMLVLQHQSVYYQFLNGLENILDIFREK